MVRVAGKKYPPPYLAWTVWGLGAALYFTGFFHRVAPAVMTDQLMVEFDIGAAALGNFSAFYFYSYVAMQIPTGILSDLWGPRRLLTCGTLVVSMGAFIFAVSSTVFVANLGRLLIGGSVAVAFVAMLKLATHWFPPSRFAAMGGLGLCCGVVGAVSAGVPLRLMVDSFGWRPVMLAAACVSLALTAAVWFVVRDVPEDKGYTGYSPPASHPTGSRYHSVAAGLKTVLKFKSTWLLS